MRAFCREMLKPGHGPQASNALRHSQQLSIVYFAGMLVDEDFEEAAFGFAVRATVRCAWPVAPCCCGSRVSCQTAPLLPRDTTAACPSLALQPQHASC